MQKYKIYLDVCCYNRPFDDQTHDIVHIEAEAVLTILKLCEFHDLILYKSKIVDLEISKISNDFKKSKVNFLKDVAQESIEVNSEVASLAKSLEKAGITAFDALHVALAQEADTIFITTDHKLINKCNRLKDLVKISIKNPVDFVMEVLND